MRVAATRRGHCKRAVDKQPVFIPAKNSSDASGLLGDAPAHRPAQRLEQDHGASPAGSCGGFARLLDRKSSDLRGRAPLYVV